MKPIFQTIHSLILKGESFSLATILEREGSAPRTTGARMVVQKDGHIIETIGGGLLEAQVIQAAQEAAHSHQDIVASFHFNAKEAGDLGMICGGSVKVLVQWIDAADAGQQALYHALDKAIRSRQKAWLVTVVDVGAAMTVDLKKPARVTQALLSPDGVFQGARLENMDRLARQLVEKPIRRPEWFDFDGVEGLVEPITQNDTVFLFGAGHVAQMVAPLASWVGFNVVVLDDREEFACAERYATVDEIIVLDSFDKAFSHLEVGPQSYVVIVTRGHQKDLEVLAQALETEAGYIGMIGSQRKREIIYRTLIERGVTRERLAQVHSPIGTAIGAETPEEIAVSIVGELIQARAQN